MRRMRLFQTEQQLLDYILDAVRENDVHPWKPWERDMILREIQHHWRPDRKRDKIALREYKAHAIERELADMVAAETTVGEAKETLAREYGHNSVPAFNKWLRRNRPRRRRSRLRDA
jgi:hypothetical protein